MLARAVHDSPLGSETQAAFCMMSLLVSQYQLSAIFAPGLKRVGLCFYQVMPPTHAALRTCMSLHVTTLLDGCLSQLSRLLRVHLPQLSRHLSSLGITPPMYSAGWLMTIYSRCVRVSVVCHHGSIGGPAHKLTTCALVRGLCQLRCFASCDCGGSVECVPC